MTGLECFPDALWRSSERTPWNPIRLVIVLIVPGCLAAVLHLPCMLSHLTRHLSNPFYRKLYLGLKKFDTLDVADEITASIMY